MTLKMSIDARLIVAAATLLLWAVTAVVFLLRFWKGLGPTTNMTDAFPWGVWIGFIQGGVALSGGGFVMAATVHVFHIRRFEPILRPAVLTAFLGYIFVAASLFIEVGRPWALWHPIVNWQHHSIMFEVAWCVTLYMTVLALEFAPTVLEHFKLEKLRGWLELVTIPLVISGVILSSLHQSSLGSMFLLVPQKIYPLWYSPLLPVFFLISSIGVGMCVLIVELWVVARLFDRPREDALMRDLGRSASWVLALYMALRLADLSFRGVWPLAIQPSLQSVMFWIELVFGFLTPMALLAKNRTRQNSRLLVSAAALAAGGTLLHRINISWIGMLPYAGVHYVPSWMELAMSVTLATGVMALFLAACRYLPVLPKETTN